MREIEVKARVLNKELLLQKIDSKGIRMSDELRQRDIVYGKPGVRDNEEGSVWLRIRIENETKKILTLKKSVRGHLDSIEHETHIDDADETERIIQLIGFEKYSELTKVRRKAKIDDIELCVDTVNGLGDYIEAEMLVPDDAEHEAIENQLWGLLQELGVDKKNVELRGYDVIERASRGL